MTLPNSISWEEIESADNVASNSTELSAITVTLGSGNININGAPCPTRTDHLLITNQLLYQMS